MKEGEQPRISKAEIERQRKLQELRQNPWYPSEWALGDAEAIQALDRGQATPEQQKRALDWIINNACGYYDLSYRPGAEEGRRNTDFAEGKRFVGAQIVKLSKVSLASMRHGKNSDAHEPKF